MNKDDIEQQEEFLREEINKLDDEKKKLFFTKVEKEIKDPDTYASLNFLFLTGVHHFYLEKWLKGSINLLLFIFGLVLLFGSTFSYGFGLGIILTIVIIELNELFKSQIIVQDYNNKVLEKNLKLLK
ncbi:hypothetical protein KO488_00475 [Poseidonibacter lekithochrous]|uniref:hypothetical protein n=1 Tax=Poseidonibacter TaxID=2321187 RepID=UPI001C094F44|nr:MULTISPECIES: hypothetical protein [Poseidonibacter]MBU3013215.1 hypothetical protein [Poseidonibacter lekithochrous]MDO6826511.1 hypothetical protein [Poseidonibacter sp. 1_MG-2023]